MYPTQLNSAPAPAPTQAAYWPACLRDACEVLARTPACSIGAISVHCALAGQVAEQDSPVILSRQLAKEYGLKCTISMNGPSITVRFTRPRTRGLVRAKPHADDERTSKPERQTRQQQ